MDSFFSLFDPSEGNKPNPKKKERPQSEQVLKKKADTPKGRRRGRRANGKNETLPEESSFLCEPELGTDVVMRGGSYIERHIEVCNKTADPKQEADNKPKRKTSVRKNRRKRYKVSPFKDEPLEPWGDDEEYGTVSWNNQTSVSKHPDDNIGKNVNNLTTENTSTADDSLGRKINKLDKYDTERDKDNRNNIGKSFYNESMYKVIEKLEKVGLKDDKYLAGDFDKDELDREFASSEDVDSFDDTDSELDDSSEEVYGSLPPEPRFGNVEYKLQLVSPCEKRFQHLVTQLKWRLGSGGDAAVYVVGVRDCGALRGLRPRALRASLTALRDMAAALRATLAAVTARRVAPHRAVAEVYIRKLADTQQSVELRVAVMGANEAGKSTIVGVLTQGELDNGRGSARLNMFRHLHEVRSGTTSSLSHEILGFDVQGNVVNYGCSELMTAERIGERSAKLVAFLDLAGHTKYQRTTLHGLSGYCPHWAMLVISATAGITPITEQHLELLVALELPLFVVITKCDIAGSLSPLVQQLTSILAEDNKKPHLITDESVARAWFAPKQLILDSLRPGGEPAPAEDTLERVPVFPVSCVSGAGLSALHAYLLALEPNTQTQTKDNEEGCEFQIDEIFHVDESTGPIVGGLMTKGQLYEGDRLLIGPSETGSFSSCVVRSVRRNRARCGGVRAGQCASLGLAAGALGLRPGMVLLARTTGAGGSGERRVFGGCPSGECPATKQVSDIVNCKNVKESAKDRKNVRRKNKNLYRDLERAEDSLTKDIDNNQNLYSVEQEDEEMDKNEDSYNLPSDTDTERRTESAELDCACGSAVWLEDPNDPRGCMFFQATVHLLRHSIAIFPGFQCTVHIGNVRQTAIIEGVLSRNSEVRAGMSAPLVFRLTRCPEYIVSGRRLLLTAGQGTRGIGRVTQVFPYVP